jgi:cytochrome bd-type quinol oxidase subunit 2
MWQDHFLAMTLYAVLTAGFFSLLWKSGRRERLRYFVFVFFALVLSAVAAGWLMYPFPPHP